MDRLKKYEIALEDTEQDNELLDMFAAWLVILAGFFLLLFTLSPIGLFFMIGGAALLAIAVDDEDHTD